MLQDFWNNDFTCPSLDQAMTMFRGQQQLWMLYLEIGAISQSEFIVLDRLGPADTSCHTVGSLETIVQAFCRVTTSPLVQRSLVVLYGIWKDHSDLFVQLPDSLTTRLGDKLCDLGREEQEWSLLLVCKLLALYYCSVNPQRLVETQGPEYIGCLEREMVENGDREMAIVYCRLLSFCLQSILELRAIVVDICPTMAPTLCRLLRDEDTRPQMQYEILLVFWLLSFEKPKIVYLSELKLVPCIIDVVKFSSREKVVRLSLSVLRNMIESREKQVVSTMIGCKALELINNLSSRIYSDPDILEDLRWIKTELTEFYETLNSFEEYAAEIESGELYWSPSHKSEIFWQRNAKLLNDDNHRILRKLVELCNDSSQPFQILEIAIHDLGQYIKFYPGGRRFLDEFGGKTAMMSLIECPESRVKFEALVAVQKYMMNRW